MNRSIIISSVSHLVLIMITAFSLPFLAKKPIDLPPIVSVELIQITDKTNIPYAPKARKIIEKVKKEKERVVSEQAPPAAKAKEKDKYNLNYKMSPRERRRLELDAKTFKGRCANKKLLRRIKNLAKDNIASIYLYYSIY